MTEKKEFEEISKRKKAAFEFKKTTTPPFPKEIFLDLTSFCNHRCVFCSNPLIQDKKTMEDSMVRKVLSEAYECGTRDLGLYATGESFLVKNLAEYIKLSKDIGYEYLFITTNGALATPEKVIPCFEAGLDSIKFSISAGTRETYKEIQGKDDFDLVIENLKQVHEYRKTSGKKFKIYVTMVYTTKTECEVETLKNIVSPYIDTWDPHLLSNQCGNKHDNNELGNIDEKNPRGRGNFDICFQPFKSFTITPEGYLSACVIDYSMDLIVADLNKVSLKEAWLSETYKNFRERHLNQEYKGLICNNCMHNSDEPVEALTPEYARHFKKQKDQ